MSEIVILTIYRVFYKITIVELGHRMYMITNLIAYRASLSDTSLDLLEPKTLVPLGAEFCEVEYF